MKDSKGHGSNTGTKGMRLIKTHTLGPHTAKVYNNPEWGEHVVKFFQNGTYQPKADYHTDDKADAHSTAGAALKRYGDLDAASALGQGHPKSAPVDTHASMMASIDRGHKMRMAGDGGHVPGYNAGAVNDAIASSNRAGRRIGGKEAGAIHRLLKGRH